MVARISSAQNRRISSAQSGCTAAVTSTAATSPMATSVRHALLINLGQQTSIRFERRHLGVLELFSLQSGCLEAATLAFETDACYLMRSQIGSCELDVDSRSETRQHLSDGGLAIINSREDIQLTLAAGAEVLMLRIPDAQLAEAAVEFGYLSHQSAPRFQNRLLTPQCDAELHLLVQAMQQHPESSHARPNPAIEHYSRLLCLTLFRHTDASLGQIAQNRMPEDHRIEAIRHYVMRHIREDLAMEDLASLCNVSVKTLYNLFNREFGITPSAYIRELKLEAVHQCLKQDDSILNVTQVALDFGFTNLGRFSGQYKQLFGESPSATLKRHRARALLSSQTTTSGYSKAG